MEAYKFQTTVTEDGKIILPREMKNLCAHEVEIILLDLQDKSKLHFNPVEILSSITNEYNQIEEEDINISEIYKSREKRNGREFIFD